MKQLTFVFPGVRLQHVDRINSIQNDSWCTVEVYYGNGQTYQANRLDSSYRYIKSTQQLLTNLLRGKSDIYFIAGWYHRYCIIAIFVALIKKVPICYMSESTLYEESSNVFKRMLKSYLMRRGNSFLVGGEAQARQIRKYVKNSNRSIYFGYNTNNTYKYLKFKKLRKFNLFVGELTEKKNLRVVIEAYYLLKKRRVPLWPLRVVGDGPQRQELTDLIKTHGLEEHIHFVGVKSGDELIQLYREANFTIIPSIYEQWGFVANESLASGTPILISQFAGCNELCKSSSSLTGIVFDPASAEALSNALMITEELDYNKISDNAISLMKSFSCESLFKPSIKKIVEDTERE